MRKINQAHLPMAFSSRHHRNVNRAMVVARQQCDVRWPSSPKMSSSESAKTTRHLLSVKVSPYSRNDWYYLVEQAKKVTNLTSLLFGSVGRAVLGVINGVVWDVFVYERLGANRYIVAYVDFAHDADVCTNLHVVADTHMTLGIVL